MDEMKPRVSVLICALNEAKNMPYVLPKIPAWVHEVLLVDGYSKDNTTKLAKEIRPDIRIVQQQGKGKGDALRCGIKQATGDFIIALDCDGSMDPGEIPRFIEPLLKGFDYAKGSRFLPGGGTTDMPAIRKFGNRVFIFLVNTLFKTKYTDLCYGYMAFRKTIVCKLPIKCDGFEIETEINIKARKNNLKVVEVPSFERQRYFGKGNLHTFRDGWRILSTIIRCKLMKWPQ